MLIVNLSPTNLFLRFLPDGMNEFKNLLTLSLNMADLKF